MFYLITISPKCNIFTKSPNILQKDAHLLLIFPSVPERIQDKVRPS